MADYQYQGYTDVTEDPVISHRVRTTTSITGNTMTFTAEVQAFVSSSGSYTLRAVESGYNTRTGINLRVVWSDDGGSHSEIVSEKYIPSNITKTVQANTWTTFATVTDSYTLPSSVVNGTFNPWYYSPLAPVAGWEKSGQGVGYITSGSWDNVTNGIKPRCIRLLSNGGSGSVPNAVLFEHRWTTTLLCLKVPENAYVLPGYRFVNWGSSQNYGSSRYTLEAGALYNSYEEFYRLPDSMYAQWLAESAIADFTLQRVDSNGQADAMGSRISCTCNWSVDSRLSGSSIEFKCGSVTETVSLSGASGQASAILDVSARADTDYTVTATLTDSSGYSVNTSKTSALQYTAPSFTKLSVDRCESDGTVSDDGEYVLITTSWRVAYLGSQTGPQSLVVTASKDGTTIATDTITTFTPTASGNVCTGSTMFVMSAGDVFSSANSYLVSVVLSDLINAASASDMVDEAFFPFDILGDALLYEITQDTTVDPSKTYYERSGAGSKANPYVYTPVDDPVAALLPTYYEATGTLPGRGASFGAPADKEGFNVSMPPHCYGDPVLPTYTTDDMDDYEPPYEPCIALDTSVPELWYCHEVNEQLVKESLGKPYHMAAGRIYPYGGTTAPEGYLMCDGSAVSRTEYSALFDVIGTTFGAGDGSTTFNLPNLQGRIPMGSNSTYAMGTTGGEYTHALTPSETAVRSHTHTVWAHSHGLNGHAHSYDHYNGSVNGTKLVRTHIPRTFWHTDKIDGNDKLNVNVSGGGGWGLWATAPSAGSTATAAHNHGLGGYGATTGGNWDSTANSGDFQSGGLTESNGSAHNNMQPYQVVNYIISLGGDYTAIKGDRGVSITTITEQASTQDGGTNVITMNMSDGTTHQVTVLNGTKGSTGDAAGFGTPTASVDSNVGTPSVTVTATGPDTAKVFSFAFSNMKGETGAQGPKGETGDVGNVIHIGTSQPASDSAYILWYDPVNGSFKAKCYVEPDAYTDGGWAWRELTFADIGKNGDVYTATADTPSS